MYASTLLKKLMDFAFIMDQKKALRQLRELKKYSNKDIRLAAEAWDKPWQCLVSTMMSAQTRDTVTIVIAEKLIACWQIRMHL